MNTKFPTDADPEELARAAEHAEFVRRVVAEHKTGPGIIEPSCYEPDAEGKCHCIYCEKIEREQIAIRTPLPDPKYANAPPRPKAYGIYVGRCSCGWWTLAKSGPPASCEACRIPFKYDPTRKAWDESNWVEWTDETAATVCSFSEVKSDFLRRIASEQGYWLHQLSKNRYILLHCHHGCAPGVVTYGDKQTRAYMVPEVLAQGTLQEVGKVLREKVKDSLPAFLLDRS